MKKTILFLSLAMIAAACSKSSDDAIPSSKNLYPSKIVETNGDAVSTTTYEYNTQNRLVKSIETDNYKDIITTITTKTYTYTNDLLSEIISNQTSGTDVTIYRSVLNYVHGELTTIFEYNGTETAVTSNKDSLFYNGGNFPNIIRQHNGFENNILTYDLVGNKMTILYSDKQNNSSETTFTYDTNHRHYTWCIPSPTYIQGQFGYCPTQIKETWKENGIVSFSGTTTFSYAFNADGYPTKVTKTDLDAHTETYDITYR